jgi:hypothetical protein
VKNILKNNNYYIFKHPMSITSKKNSFINALILYIYIYIFISLSKTKKKEKKKRTSPNTFRQIRIWGPKDEARQKQAGSCAWHDITSLNLKTLRLERNLKTRQVIQDVGQRRFGIGRAWGIYCRAGSKIYPFYFSILCFIQKSFFFLFLMFCYVYREYNKMKR